MSDYAHALLTRYEQELEILDTPDPVEPSVFVQFSDGSEDYYDKGDELLKDITKFLSAGCTITKMEVLPF